MNIIEVDRNTCTGCGACAAVCPRFLIDFTAGGFPAPGRLAEASCIRCGHCITVCPTGALTHRDMPVAECLPVREDRQITREQCEHLLKSRRSIRVYTDKPVDRDTIRQLIDTARYAPSGRNSQGVRWLVIDDRDKLENIKNVGMDWLRWLLASHPEAAASFEADRSLDYLEHGKDELLRSAPVLIITYARKGDVLASTACTIALTYLELAAYGTGLGACWAGYIQGASGSFSPMREALGIPDGYANYGSMLLGYPRFRYQRIPIRKPARITWG